MWPPRKCWNDRGIFMPIWGHLRKAWPLRWRQPVMLCITNGEMSFRLQGNWMAHCSVYPTPVYWSFNYSHFFPYLKPVFSSPTIFKYLQMFAPLHWPRQNFHPSVTSSNCLYMYALAAVHRENIIIVNIGVSMFVVCQYWYTPLISIFSVVQ